ncbi:MAG: RNA polymerase sigma factor, partial [Phycisphaerales bacterium]
DRAWRIVIDLYARRIFALAKSRVRNTDVAEEITQSVFVTVAAKLGSGGYTEKGRFEAWLFRVAVNRIRDEIRRLRRHAGPTDPEQFAGLEDESAAAPHAASACRADDGLVRLRAAMTELSDTDREIVELRHHGGLSFAQIAEQLAEPLGTLLARHHRALRKLKELIEASPQGSQA